MAILFSFRYAFQNHHNVQSGGDVTGYVPQLKGDFKDMPCVMRSRKAYVYLYTSI